MSRTLDLDALADLPGDVRALRRELAEVRALLAGRLPAVTPTAPGELVPLHRIIGGTPGAARMRAARDPGLARLGVDVGRGQMRYRSEEVLSYLAATPRRRGRPPGPAHPRPRLVGGTR